MYSGVVPQHPPTIETPSSSTNRRWCSHSWVARQVVVHLPVDHRREAGVGQDRDGQPAVLGEVTEVLAHLRRSGGAVDAEHVGPHGVECGQGGTDLGAQQHPAGELDRHLHLEGHVTALGGHGGAGAEHGRLGRQQVELGLDEQEVDAAAEQAAALDLEPVAQVGEGDLAERRRLRPGTDRPGDEPAPVGRREAVGHLPSDAGVGLAELLGPLGDAVLRERPRQRAERVRLDDVAPGLEVGRVQRGHDVGPGDGQELGAALVVLAAVVVGGEALGLEPGAGGAVVDDDSFRDESEVGGVHGLGKATERPSGARSP